MTMIDGLDLGAWAAQFRMAEFDLAPGDLVCLGDHEVAYHIARRHGVWLLEFVSRGGPRQGLGSFSDPVGAARLLVIEVGTVERSERRLPPLRGTVADDVEIEDGPTATHLRWDGGWAELALSRIGAAAARLYSQAVGHPLPDVADSVLHTVGAPVFGHRH